MCGLDSGMTEREKMVSGELYVANDPQLVAARIKARRLVSRLNTSDPGDIGARFAVMRDLLGAVGAQCWIEPPFHCDYGWNIELGDEVFVNFGGIFLDCAPIVIGAQTQLGPNVQLLAADHPRDAAARVSGREFARPIRIGKRAWLGGGVIVCPGVTIGDDTIVGAGSVVVRDLPSGVMAAGNPCRVVREL